MNRNYTTDTYGNGDPARPYPGHPFGHRTTALPYILGAGRVRELARETADSMIDAARESDTAVTFVTGNAYMPPLRSFPAAERVWNADNNDDVGLWEEFVWEVEDRLSAANVLMQSPDWDNSIYVVDMNRWQYREPGPGEDDLSDEWEPADPHATDDHHDNPRE